MVRKSGVIVLGLLVGLFFVVASWPYLSYQMENPNVTMTGNSISEAISSFYETSSISKRIIILSQIILLFVIAIAVFFTIRKLRPKSTLFKEDYVIDGGNKRSRTDLDILYEMLRRRKVDLEDVEKAFKVSPEIALGWAKVLEDGDLAEIDYPRFGKPVLKLAKENIAIENEEKRVVAKAAERVVTDKANAKKAIVEKAADKVVAEKAAAKVVVEKAAAKVVAEKAAAKKVVPEKVVEDEKIEDVVDVKPVEEVVPKKKVRDIIKKVVEKVVKKKSTKKVEAKKVEAKKVGAKKVETKKVETKKVGAKKSEDLKLLEGLDKIMSKKK